MKSSIKLIPFAFFVLALLFANVCGAQDKPEAEAFKAGLENRSYIFNASSASPQKGGFVRLNPGYRIVVKGDTLVCDLPYYGRVYNASYGGDAGFKFTSAKYEQTITPKKKGGWNVKIETNDLTANRRMFMTVFDNGSASLSITSSDRQSISYQGTVVLVK